MNGFNRKYMSLFCRSLVVLLFTSAYVLPARIVASQSEFESNVSSDIKEVLSKDIQKGMSYVTWDRDRFSSQHSDDSLKKLSSLGVNFLSLCVTLYQDTYNSTEIKITDMTPTDQSLIHVMKTASKLGIKVMLKPHIDLIDKGDGTYWRADIGFNNDADWAKWFKSYEKIILHYAEMAEKYKAEIFCVGTELSFTQSQESSWRDIITKIRGKFTGKIVYAANWDTFKSIKFWDLLDYVGIDAYFPLSYATAPTLEELEQGWKKWVDEIAEWQKTVNKPVVFTEIGYASTPGAAYNPWQEGTSGNSDASVQAMCYEAFFNVVWDAEWLAGVYWWKWDTNTRAGGVYNRQFTPQNKPAQEIIEKHYKGHEETSEAS